MDDQELAQLETLCAQFYGSSDPSARTDAEKALVLFSESTGSLTKCQFLLERAQSSYARLLAANTLEKLVTKPTSQLTMTQRLETRSYILNYLFSRPKETHYISQALIRLIAKITKVSWFDTTSIEDPVYPFRNILEEASKFLQSSLDHGVVGVEILSKTVEEMNKSEYLRSLTMHRKIAASFRDQKLFDIFQLAASLLKQGVGKQLENEAQHSLMGQLLSLACNCLTFDFIGTAADEASDDMATVQVPTSWRSDFLDPATLQLFFDLYSALPSALSSISLRCLVQMTSVRRSLFNTQERQTFLNNLAQGVKRILENPQALAQPENYHEFCRLLARLKANYQLGELVKVDNYLQIVELMAKFTVSSLQSWQFSANSIHYLLSLWQRMVASIPYVNATEPHMLDTYAPEITRAYLISRLESVGVVLRDGLDDPLDDMGLVGQQLDQMQCIGRCQYEKTVTLVVSYFDSMAQSYQDSVQQGSPDVRLQEGQLTWLVYFIGCVIGGRVSFTNSEDEDSLDGELVYRVLQLMSLTDSRLPQGGGCQRLELAMMNFFEHFRKIYIGDQITKSKVYKVLAERLGITEESMLLTIYIRKIISNMKFWARSEIVIKKTLQLFSDLSVGYSSARKLVKLESVQLLLNNHTPEHLPFLISRAGADQLDMRYRTTFYSALSRLLMIELGEDEDRFERFMLPLAETFQRVAGQLANVGSPVFPEDELRLTFIGLCRDLQGVAYAFVGKTSFMMLFEWLYPRHFEVLQQCLTLWCHVPQVSTPLLKLVVELVQNKQQRLQFDVSSPSGILLFREVSKIVVTYGSRILSLPNIPSSEIYATKYKGVAITFQMLKYALSGNYVNFGVFRLYGDEALDNALNMFVKLVISIPQNDLMHYPKLCQAYFNLLEVVAQDHMNFFASVEPQIAMYLLSSINDGLSSLEMSICTGCCATLDYVVTYIFKSLMKHKVTSGRNEESSPILRILDLHPEVLHQMLSTIMNIIMFEDCRNQWSMSRPLLGLILLAEKHFEQLRDSVIRMQPTDRQRAMEVYFQSLMEGVERNLLPKNRDRFTQNLSVFRRDVNNSMKEMPVVVLTLGGPIGVVVNASDVLSDAIDIINAADAMS
ncbi:exportin-7-like [Corticium candelabrum]|uniref:exportin-7-like n=1 Tax=Corticium candelabrum TaxID=121492 RepID=UPI002E25B619|nr:exportin-7-like [Corticium candelabrum]